MRRTRSSASDEASSKSLSLHLSEASLLTSPDAAKGPPDVAPASPPTQESGPDENSAPPAKDESSGASSAPASKARPRRVKVGTFAQEAAFSQKKLAVQARRKEWERERARAREILSQNSSNPSTPTFSPRETPSALAGDLRALKDQVRALTQPRAQRPASAALSLVSSSSSPSFGPVTLPSPRRRLVLTKDAAMNTSGRCVILKSPAAPLREKSPPKPQPQKKLTFAAPKEDKAKRSVQKKPPSGVAKRVKAKETSGGGRKSATSEVVAELGRLHVTERKKKPPKPASDSPVSRGPTRPKPRSSLFRVLGQSSSEDESWHRLPRMSKEGLGPKASPGPKAPEPKDEVKVEAEEAVGSSQASSQAAGRKKGLRTGAPTIVLTLMRREEREAGVAATRSLGGFRFRSEVGGSTTHVVVGERKRSLAVLRGMAMGVWVLPLRWVLESLEAGRWLEEEAFELTEEWPGLRRWREERERGLVAGLGRGLLRRQDGVWLSRLNDLPAKDLGELVRLCGGTVYASLQRASLCLGPSVGQRHKDLGKTLLSPAWLLDSLSQGRRLPTEPYQLPE